MGVSCQTFFVSNYELGATLSSGQAFRWRPSDSGGWRGVVGRRWVRLTQTSGAILAETPLPCSDWDWLVDYLQLRIDLDLVLATFPDEPPMRAATDACRGLRLLRQDPWECLASFILSSTKQIVQIQQIVDVLCNCFGSRIPTLEKDREAFSFPDAARLAQADETELRACKMGFRAPYLLGTARAVANGDIDLAKLGYLPIEEARAQLMELPGVGRKIADCVLLFAYGFQKAFPVDVWILRALKSLYFPRRKLKIVRVHAFATSHFGPYGGYAQQYLFHHMRLARSRAKETAGS